MNTNWNNDQIGQKGQQPRYFRSGLPGLLARQRASMEHARRMDRVIDDMHVVVCCINPEHDLRCSIHALKTRIVELGGDYDSPGLTYDRSFSERIEHHIPTSLFASEVPVTNGSILAGLSVPTVISLKHSEDTQSAP